MKKITTDGKYGFLHLIGEFDKVRVKQGGKVVEVPRWDFWDGFMLTLFVLWVVGMALMLGRVLIDSFKEF